MLVRRLLAVGLWVCVTAAATAIVWAGTSTVAADLTDRPPPVVGHRDVVTALESGDPDDKTAPGITTPGASGTTSTVPPARRQSPGTPAGTPAAAPAAPAPPAGVATTVAPAPPPAPPGPAPASPPTTPAPQRPTATYATTGGVVTVACQGFFIDVVSATPAAGYAVDVVTGGPYYIEVHFRRSGRDYPVWAFCLGQPIRAYGGPPYS